MTPVFILVGAAGSGKDTVASLITKYTNTALIAQADPMKRFAAKVFDFSEYQLWGPSEARNGEDNRYDSPFAWQKAEDQFLNNYTGWIDEVLPDIDSNGFDYAEDQLRQWFYHTVKSFHVAWAISHSNADRPEFKILQRLTPRYVLQTLGTEWGRVVNPEMWFEYAERTAFKLLEGGPRYDRTVGLTDDISYHPPDFVGITDGRFRNEVLGTKLSGGFVIQVVNPASKDTSAGIQGHRSETEQKTMPEYWMDIVIHNDKTKGLLALENSLQPLLKWMKTRTLHLGNTNVGE